MGMKADHPLSITYIRQFLESMKALGYSGSQLSMEIFLTPHFDVVADCIRWLLRRYDPGIELHADITTEEGRVAFLKSAGQFVFSRTRIKLNLRNLYAAGSGAAQELFRLSSLLQKSISVASSSKYVDADSSVFKKSFDVKAARLLVLEIIKSGAAVYDDLAAEMELQKARCTATSTNTDIEQIENMMREAINGLLQSVSSVEEQRHACERDEKTLHATFEKRKIELERCKKRLSVLQNVRPAYVDEYEMLQKDLQRLFGIYLEKFHNLQWLESQLEIHNQEEKEKLQESYTLMRRLQQRVHNENIRILHGEEVGKAPSTSYDDSTNSWCEVPLVAPLSLLNSSLKATAQDHPSQKEDSSESVQANENEDVENVSTDDDF